MAAVPSSMAKIAPKRLQLPRWRALGRKISFYSQGEAIKAAGLRLTLLKRTLRRKSLFNGFEA